MKSKATVAKRSEKAIQRAILDFLATIPGVEAWKSGAGAFRLSYKGKTRFVRMGKRGVSDIVGFARTATDINSDEPCGLRCRGRHLARFLAIEVKRPGSPFKPGQKEFLERVTQAGGIAVVAHSVADVAEALGVAVPAVRRAPEGKGRAHRMGEEAESGAAGAGREASETRGG